MTEGYGLARYDRATWTREVVTDHPPIPPVLREIKGRVTDKLHANSDPLYFWPHGDVWAAVMDLHRDGRHDDASALAKVLVWIDAQGHDFMWEFLAPSQRVEESEPESACVCSGCRPAGGRGAAGGR